MASSSSHHEENGGTKEDKQIELGKSTPSMDADLQSIEVELAAGARAFAFKNYAVATECFSKACEQLIKHHSDNIDAIIDAHISYGKALLRNAISLGGLLGGLENQNFSAEVEDTTSQTPDVADSSSKDQRAVASTSKPTKSTDHSNTNNPNIYFSGDSSDEDGDEADEVDDQAEPTEEPLTVEEELENAFQALDFTRQSIESQIDSLKTSSSNENGELLKKYHSKLVDVYDLIAQVHQEGEQFELAVESYKSLLDIKKSTSNFSPGSISETHLMIALALELIPDDGTSIKQAIEHVNEAIEIMKGHLKNLEEKSQFKASNKTTSPEEGEEKTIPSQLQASEPIPKVSDHQEKRKDEDGPSLVKSDDLSSEIEDVKALISDLEGKRDELNDVPELPPITESDKALQAYLAAVNQNPSTNSPHAKTLINDLNSLVKKRPRPNEKSAEKIDQVSYQSDQKVAPNLESPSKKKKI